MSADISAEEEGEAFGTLQMWAEHAAGLEDEGKRAMALLQLARSGTIFGSEETTAFTIELTIRRACFRLVISGLHVYDITDIEQRYLREFTGRTLCDLVKQARPFVEADFEKRRAWMERFNAAVATWNAESAAKERAT